MNYIKIEPNLPSFRISSVPLCLYFEINFVFTLQIWSDWLRIKNYSQFFKSKNKIQKMNLKRYVFVCWWNNSVRFCYLNWNNSTCSYFSSLLLFVQFLTLNASWHQEIMQAGFFRTLWTHFLINLFLQVVDSFSQLWKMWRRLYSNRFFNKKWIVNV